MEKWVTGGKPGSVLRRTTHAVVKIQLIYLVERNTLVLTAPRHSECLWIFCTKLELIFILEHEEFCCSCTLCLHWFSDHRSRSLCQQQLLHYLGSMPINLFNPMLWQDVHNQPQCETLQWQFAWQSQYLGLHSVGVQHFRHRPLPPGWAGPSLWSHTFRLLVYLYWFVLLYSIYCYRAVILNLFALRHPWSAISIFGGTPRS